MSEIIDEDMYCQSGLHFDPVESIRVFFARVFVNDAGKPASKSDNLKIGVPSSPHGSEHQHFKFYIELPRKSISVCIAHDSVLFTFGSRATSEIVSPSPCMPSTAHMMKVAFYI